MKYDVYDVALRVEAKKRRFKITAATCIFLIIAAVFVAIYIPETTVVFLCAVTVIFSGFYLWKFIHKSNPMITFSAGFRGENIKEHEYVTAGSRLTRYGGLRYRYIPSRHKGDVYIRREDGEIVVVTHLPKKHLDIYEIGDTLLCYPGTRFPVVVNREVPEQPCPICGTINGCERECCSACGLKILQKRK